MWGNILEEQEKIILRRISSVKSRASKFYRLLIFKQACSCQFSSGTQIRAWTFSWYESGRLFSVNCMWLLKSNTWVGVATAVGKSLDESALNSLFNIKLGAKKCALPSQVIGLKITDKESGMFSSFIFKTKGYFNLFAENKDERFFPEILYMCIFFKII